MKSTRALILFILGAALVASAIAFNERGVHLSMLQGPVLSLNPLEAVDTNTQLIVNNSFDGLVSWDPSEGIRPSLAKSWEIDETGTTVTFQIRSDARFHNGDRLESADICRSLTSLTTTASYFFDHYQVIKSVECPARRTVIVRLRHKYPDLMLLLSGVGAKIAKRSSNGHWLGVGPFEPFLGGKEVRLVRSTYYWGQRPSVNEIHFKIMDESDAIARAGREELDDVALIPLTGKEIPPSIGQYVTQPMWATWIVGLDQRVPPLDQKAVREELVDRLKSHEFVKSLYPDQEPALGLLPFGVAGFLEDSRGSRPQRAISRGSSKVQVEVFVPSMLVKASGIANWIEGAFAESWLKVKVTLKPFDWMIENYAKGRMGAYFLSINAEYPDPTFIIRSLTSRSSSNFLGIRSGHLDGLIGEIENSEISPKRAALARQVNEYLLKDSASVNLVHVRHRAWKRTCVSGIRMSPVSEGYTDYRGLVNRCR